MKIAANYPGFAYAFRSFLNDKEYKSPSDEAIESFLKKAA